MTDTLALVALAGLALVVAVLLAIRLRALSRRRVIRLEQAPPAAAVASPPAPPAESPAFTPPPAAGPPDDLKRIKGIGPKLEALLNGLGITRYAQLAELSPEAMAALDARLGPFQGRPARDRWQEQARLLAEGDLAAFERQHGRLGERP
ncbi:MAG: hypothetical protein NZM40_01470 [Sphingomonadaceae bacterium]|uniref:hypothetical protein n=1 Tax=Thermaurantiacus sp. TaxID=2820283 RepID=UPI00298F1FC6|nr:hypothetical protein [Thermaurantiacus sp.]MCS6986112.1 hypothetical protein [Sphingomonadaceae bacterium]MDW8414672.1 hypothetical protein [Thermaurantiacus sp.]